MTLVQDIFYTYSQNAASGPDHIYSFTLTDRGPNPQIEVSATSGTFKPMIYVLAQGKSGGCPAGTGNFALNEWILNDSRWSPTHSATLDHNQVSYLPLNVPLYLFVDSDSINDSGHYTIRMQDVTIGCANAIDCTESFVHQQYLDFLNREPDADGLNFWTNEITSCGGEPQCTEGMRINVSAAFFLSIEFQQTGYLVYRTYKASFGNLPDAPVPIRFSGFMPDTQEIGHGVVVNQSGWETVLENNKQSFMSEFVQRDRFTTAYPPSLTPDQFVDTLFANAGVTPSETDRAAAINEFASTITTNDTAARARALRRAAENTALQQQEFNRAFVLMQYFGYLRRNPNDSPDGNFDGYNFWLNKLNLFSGDFQQAEMVKAFLSSTEYRQRFGP